MIDRMWIDISHVGNPSYEEELDARASPESSDRHKYRHRLRSFDGAQDEWSPGRAPEPKEVPK